MIIIHPAIEKWLLKNAEDAAITPLNLGNQLDDLKSFTKRKSIHNNQHFYVFIKQLIQHQPPGITTLKKWIEKFLAGENLE